MVKQALVIHPVMDEYAGGEFLSLQVCSILQELGYEVILACRKFEPAKAEEIYGMGEVMENCTQIEIPSFRPRYHRFLAIQRLEYARAVWPMLKKIKPAVTFSTQSSPFFLSHAKTFHFVYNIVDLFGYPPDASPLPPLRIARPLVSPIEQFWNDVREFYWRSYYVWPNWYFGVGTAVLSDLKQRGYENSSLLFPPCRTQFKPRLPKRKQVVQIARVIPDKRLEIFLEIARRLPEYEFVLVGKRSLVPDEQVETYYRKILGSLPDNVVYEETAIQKKPELLTESKVYLYTGNEKGIVMAIAEAMAAGCLPVSPEGVGAADLIVASGVGELYRDINEAVAKIRSILESHESSDQVHRISRKAELFSVHSFKDRIRGLIV